MREKGRGRGRGIFQQNQRDINFNSINNKNSKRESNEEIKWNTELGEEENANDWGYINERERSRDKGKSIDYW